MAQGAAWIAVLSWRPGCGEQGLVRSQPSPLSSQLGQDCTASQRGGGWKCEACGNKHGKAPYVLTVDHVVDHSPANVKRSNLAALCQRCHLRRQAMRPAPKTKREALMRLRLRYEGEQTQARLL